MDDSCLSSPFTSTNRNFLGGDGHLVDPEVVPSYIGGWVFPWCPANVPAGNSSWTSATCGWHPDGQKSLVLLASVGITIGAWGIRIFGNAPIFFYNRIMLLIFGLGSLGRISIQWLCDTNPANASILFLESLPFFSSKLTQPNGTSFFFFKHFPSSKPKSTKAWDRGEEGFWRDLVNLWGWKKIWLGHWVRCGLRCVEVWFLFKKSWSDFQNGMFLVISLILKMISSHLRILEGSQKSAPPTQAIQASEHSSWWRKPMHF